MRSAHYSYRVQTDYEPDYTVWRAPQAKMSSMSSLRFFFFVFFIATCVVSSGPLRFLTIIALVVEYSSVTRRASAGA
jgi:hypothetical protein